MRNLKKITAIFLIGILLCSSYCNVLAAPTSPISSSSGFINAREIFGYEGKIYTISKENGSYLRSDPHDKGDVITTLPYGYPIKIEGMYQSNKGTYWFLLSPDDLLFEDNVISSYVWVYAGNCIEHTHDYRTFDTYNYEFCISCGHLRSTQIITLTETSNDLEILLALLSITPVIGNAFDCMSAMLNLYNGRIGAATLDLLSAIPILGTAGVLRFGETLKLRTRTTEFLYTIEKVDGSVGSIEIRPIRNTARLGKNMNTMYELTGLQRYNNYSQSIARSEIAAHHIVAIEASAAKPARDILLSLAIEPNGASNGVYLCKTSNICGSTLHQYLHSASYYSRVNERIIKAYNSVASWGAKRDAVILELDRIATDLARNNPL